MRRKQLAQSLIEARSASERRRLVKANSRLADEKLGAELRRICYASWAADPKKAQKAALAALSLLEHSPTDENRATSLWVSGIAELTKGHFVEAGDALKSANQIFLSLGRAADAAQTNVARLLALAMQGRYEEAINVGERALAVFLSTRDHLAAGKILMNLSNIVSRRSEHRESERYGLSARAQFIKAGEKEWLAMAENGLANTYTELNEFEKARKFYDLALATAREQKMTVTEAEIEASLGNLSMLRGEFASALRELETSRQLYAGLDMPHQSAIAELEMADIYAELNLGTEAVEIYRRVSQIFARLRMRAEEARSRLNYGRVSLRSSDHRAAKREFARAFALFRSEANASGQTMALLGQVEIELANGRASAAIPILERASQAIAFDQNPRHRIALKRLEGKTARSLGKIAESAQYLDEALTLAKKHGDIDAVHEILDLQGQIAVLSGDHRKAYAYFKRSIATVEGLLRTLTVDEYSMAFFAARLAPFRDLTDLYLSKGQFARAFETIERGRSRSLLTRRGKPARGRMATEKLIEEIGSARSELNASYRRFEQGASGDTEYYKSEIARREKRLAEMDRQLSSLTVADDDPSIQKRPAWDANSIGPALRTNETLIEFIEHHGQIGAFVLTGRSLRFIQGLATVDQLDSVLTQLHFQFDAIRYGGETIQKFAAQLTQRAQSALRALYDLVFKPLENQIVGDRLIVVPAGPLFYIPFQALFDGSGYLVERFEIAVAPSASVWSRLPAPKPVGTDDRSLLVAYADDKIPLAESEIMCVAQILPNSRSLSGDEATYATFLDEAKDADLIHMACHGQFRADNPMFSSLRLADGWVTVRDLCKHRMQARLVTLSACETGVNKLFAGDEILGLTRGFLSAGAASLIVSLWTVSDAAATSLMPDLYSFLQRGASPAASLRDAQLQCVSRGEHPYLWAPFVYLGH